MDIFNPRPQQFPLNRRCSSSICMPLKGGSINSFKINITLNALKGDTMLLLPGALLFRPAADERRSESLSVHLSGYVLDILYALFFKFFLFLYISLICLLLNVTFPEIEGQVRWNIFCCFMWVLQLSRPIYGIIIKINLPRIAQ